LAGCVSSSCQSCISSDTSRPLEARGVVDRRKEAKSCDWTNTWCCHEPSHLSIIAGQPQHLAVEVRNLSPDSLASLEQRFYGGCNCWPMRPGGASSKSGRLRCALKAEVNSEHLMTPRPAIVG